MSNSHLYEANFNMSNSIKRLLIPRRSHFICNSNNIKNLWKGILSWKAIHILSVILSIQSQFRFIPGNYVCVRVCMYVYKCIHTKTCTYMYVSTCVCAVYISVYIHIFFPEVLLAYMHTHLPFFSSFSSTRTKLTSTKATALWYFWRLSITAVAQRGYSSRHYKLAQISRYHTPLIPTTLLVS